jgi:aminodeoxychorismate lyase
MADPYVWVNGRLAVSDAPCLLPSDRGVLYGDGLFETLRLYGGQAFRLKAHWRRLCEAAAVLRIPPVPLDLLENGVREVVQANRRTEGALRITLTRGAQASGLDPGPAGTPTLLVATAPLRPDLDKPLRLVTVSIRRDEQSPLSRIKSLNYLPNILARFEVKEKEGDEGILLNTQGALAEGTISNIFWIKGQTLYTPAPSCGILPGIARAVVLEIAPETGLEAEEGVFEPAVLRPVQGIFMTNSLMEIVPVATIDGLPVDDAALPTVKRLQALYRQTVDRDGRQGR